MPAAGLGAAGRRLGRHATLTQRAAAQGGGAPPRASVQGGAGAPAAGCVQGAEAAGNAFAIPAAQGEGRWEGAGNQRLRERAWGGAVAGGGVQGEGARTPEQ